MDIKQTIDAIGLACPLPLLKVKQALNTMNTGDIVEVLATDSASVRDFRTYANISGHNLLLSEHNDTIYRYLLQKK